MATAPQFDRTQLFAARAAAYHQADEPLLTLEAFRPWLEQAGFVAFAPLPQLGAPMPSMVEALLGQSKAEPTGEDLQTARGLMARMVQEGTAVPLNLLGSPGDAPDFVVSATAFPFVFTLRGDKGWKRAPETSGAVKVTPLAHRVYELLAEKGALSAEEIVSEAGREVTASAVQRALTELWALLRVIPIYPQDAGEAVLWELTTKRFIKGVKAGANAGQPTALSALVSLYLGQVIAATEEEIAGFLSPLTARSRIRETVHGLSAARQLGEIVLEGKAHLFVADQLPDFAALTPAEDEVVSEPATGEEIEALSPKAEEDGERIRSFKPAGGARGEMRGKPFRPAERKPYPRKNIEGNGPSNRPGFGRSQEEERVRRPFRRDAASGGDRPFAPRREAGSGTGGDRPFRKPGGFGFKKPGFARPEGGDRPNFKPRRPAGEGGGDRPGFKPRGSFGDGGGDRPNFRPRDNSGEGGGDRGGFKPRKPFGSGDREGFKPRRPSGEGAGARPGFKARGNFGEGGGDRGGFKPRKAFGSGSGSGFQPRRSFGEGSEYRPGFKPRGSFGAGGGDRPNFKPRGSFGANGGDREGFKPRTSFGAGDRPGFKPRAPRPFAGGEDRPRKPFGERPEGGRREGGSRPFPRREGGGEGSPARFDRPSGPGRPSGFNRPAGGFRKPGGGGKFSPRPGGPRPGGFGKSGPARPGGSKPRRTEEE